MKQWLTKQCEDWRILPSRRLTQFHEKSRTFRALVQACDSARPWFGSCFRGKGEEFGLVREPDAKLPIGWLQVWLVVVHGFHSSGVLHPRQHGQAQHVTEY